jgi:hypothetical protein
LSKSSSPAARTGLATSSAAEYHPTEKITSGCERACAENLAIWEVMAMRYVSAIITTGASLWLLATIRMYLIPPSRADICGDPDASCCMWCFFGAWFTFLPMFGLALALVLFLPGHLLVWWTARRVTWWRSVYWLAGWVASGVIGSVLFSTATTFADRKFIALNNGIIMTRVLEFLYFTTLFATFGLVCGTFYWMMLRGESGRKSRDVSCGDRL